MVNIEGLMILGFRSQKENNMLIGVVYPMAVSLPKRGPPKKGTAPRPDAYPFPNRGALDNHRSLPVNSEMCCCCVFARRHP